VYLSIKTSSTWGQTPIGIKKSIPQNKLFYRKENHYKYRGVKMKKRYLKSINFSNIFLFIINLIMLISLFFFLAQIPELIYSFDYVSGYVKALNCANEPLPLSNIYEVLKLINGFFVPWLLLLIVSPIILFCKLQHAILAVLCEILIIMTMFFILGMLIIIHYMAVFFVV
jgi:hypothetical protein